MLLELYTKTICKEILENTFFINFKNIRDDIVNLGRIEKEDIMKNIHNICIKHLRNYLLSTQDYFKPCDDILRLHELNFYLLQYAYENLQLYLKLNYNLNETISLQKAFKKFNDNCLIEIDLKNLKRNLKKFKGSNDNLLCKNLFFAEINNSIGKYNIYDNLSNVLIHTINYWGLCGYNNENMFNENVYNIDEKFLIEFIMLKNLEINDIYYFERIHNINFKFYLYKEIVNIEKLNSNFNESQILKLIKILNNIIYLPNVFNNVGLMLRVMSIYIDYYKNVDIDEFEKSIMKLCTDILEYFLPLYNSLFLEILDIYNDLNGYNIDIIKKRIVLDKYLEKTVYKDSLLNKKDRINIIKEHEKLIDIKNLNNNLYFLSSENIICYFNFNRLRQENMISNFNIFNKNILNFINNSKQYQIELREFILKINKLRLID